MIVGTGIDIVQTERMRRWRDTPGLLERFFHPGEIADARIKGTQSLTSLAARYAAKEAFGKALGTGLKGIRLRDVEVRNDRLGKPHLMLHASAAEAMRNRGGGTIHLSLSHEKEYAVASIIIEKDHG